MHRHGWYSRFAKASGTQRFRVERFRCPQCRLTLSVLPADCVPYRPLPATRLGAFFNQEAEAGVGPDPPPDELEAGCLRRAWRRFQTRGNRLREVFGLMIDCTDLSAGALWKQLRLAKGTLPEILLYLAGHHKCSLLGDYRCLRLPD